MFRIIYEIAGSRHTFWSRDWEISENGLIEAVNVETGHEKHLSSMIPLSITKVDTVPPRVQEAIAYD